MTGLAWMESSVISVYVYSFEESMMMMIRRAVQATNILEHSLKSYSFNGDYALEANRALGWHV